MNIYEAICDILKENLCLEEDFDFIVQNCRSASMQLNPRPMSDGEVRTLLRKLI